MNEQCDFCDSAGQVTNGEVVSCLVCLKKLAPSEIPFEEYKKDWVKVFVVSNDEGFDL